MQRGTILELQCFDIHKPFCLQHCDQFCTKPDLRMCLRMTMTMVLLQNNAGVLWYGDAFYPPLRDPDLSDEMGRLPLAPRVWWWRGMESMESCGAAWVGSSDWANHLQARCRKPCSGARSASCLPLKTLGRKPTRANTADLNPLNPKLSFVLRLVYHWNREVLWCVNMDRTCPLAGAFTSSKIKKRDNERTFGSLKIADKRF